MANDLWSIDYVKLIPVLIEAIKDQQEQITRLTDENRVLQSQNKQITELEEKYQNLMRMMEHFAKTGN